jgi:TonB family protein
MTWWHYLLLVNIYLVLFFGFYVLLLRRETFFQLNRIYLVGAALLSFFIPLIQVQWVRDLFITKQVQSTIYSTTAPDMIVGFAPIKDNSITIGEMLIALYITGAVILALRLVWHLVLLRRIINKPTSAAYSFFKKIKLAGDIPGRDIIIRHEEVHAQQWHSADVLIIEAVMIVNWFNPVVYLYRLAIKHIHEFIADRQALKAGTNKADYALLLLSQTFNSPVHHLVNPFFNHSLLKQRIMMLQKSNSQRIKLAKYGLSAPLFVLMLILSSATIYNSKAVKVINNKAEEVFLQPATSVIPDEEPQVVQHKAVLEIIKPDGTKFNATDYILPGSINNNTKTIDTIPKKKQVFTAVEHPPVFPGGDKAFGQFLAKNVKYPKQARENNVQGKVITTFIVEPNGELTDIKILRGIGSGADEESVRVLKISPKWEPGIQNGRKVRVQYTVPIHFQLQQTTITYTPPKNNEKAPEVDQQVVEENQKQIFTAVEQAPGFPGGDVELHNYLVKNVRYPAKARKNKTQGRVIVTFVVEPDGSITNTRVVRGIGDGADEEALRVIKASPKWLPGIQNGRKVRVAYTIPIQFSLAKTEKTGAIPATKNSGNKVMSFTDNLPDSSKENVKLLGLNGKNDPLYIVDGKEVESINNIDPKSIESISVLKDASATNLYGVKALNGVILVSLKKVKAKN